MTIRANSHQSVLSPKLCAMRSNVVSADGTDGDAVLAAQTLALAGLGDCRRNAEYRDSANSRRRAAPITAEVRCA